MNQENEIKAIIDCYTDLSKQYSAIIENLSETELNKIPFAGSWTAAELINHISRANNHEAFLAPGETVNRDIGENIPELKSNFLNFDIKMDSPDFLIPESRKHSKKESLDAIQNAFKNLSEHVPQCQLNQSLSGILGDLTKWELANFIVFHSQRHLKQLQNIEKSLKSNDN